VKSCAGGGGNVSGFQEKIKRGRGGWWKKLEHRKTGNKKDKVKEYKRNF
jgi:hypothetical protein